MSITLVPAPTAKQLAQETIDALNLVTFIRSWNSGEYSLIANWNDFDLALTFDPARDHRLDAARADAGQQGMDGEFETATRALLAPVISESFQSGLAILCETWAKAIAESSPTGRNAPAPFRNERSWIAWCLRDPMQPVFANPVGEPLFPLRQERVLLTAALRTHRRVAARQGWLPE
jgi:hypothetical protein